MSTGFPIKEFRVATKAGSHSTSSIRWSDIDGLSLDFNKKESGKFLVTLNIPGTSNDFAHMGAIFRLILRPKDGGPGAEKQLDQGYYTSAVGGQIVTFSLVCEADIGGDDVAWQIVAQWATFNGFTVGSAGVARIYEGLCTLSAVGSLRPRRECFDDKNHFEYPELFSRGLRLTNFTETLFLAGYSATPPLPGGTLPLKLSPPAQMQWIVDHLDEFFATIPYADGTGYYSKHDVVYFDLVIDQTVSSTPDNDEQDAVLKVLEEWFKPVDPKPSTGILKKVEALAFPTTQVEIELILAH